MDRSDVMNFYNLIRITATAMNLIYAILKMYIVIKHKIINYKYT